MTDLNALTIFAKVVEANSFSEAARRIFPGRRLRDDRGELKGCEAIARTTAT
jgi:hypothetical protein